jgi:flagellar assembly protein FliH
MAKHVFKPTEIINIAGKVMLEPPVIQAQEAEMLEEQSIVAEEPEKIEDIRQEALSFKENWEQERDLMIANAKEEATRIVKEAEAAGFDEVKKKTDQAQKIRQEAETNAKIMLDESKKNAEDLEKKINERTEEAEKLAYEKGYKEGHELGYKTGTDEVTRLVDRLHLIITKTIERRNEIIEEAETQLINLVLMIAQKVIKVISENQKNVVINNVIQALRKVKGRGNVIIRVNLADLELASSHMKEFQSLVENVKNITVLEDSSVDRGGCIIETDFGQVDARISSQLHEIEEKILDLMPIKSKGGEGI